MQQLPVSLMMGTSPASTHGYIAFMLSTLDLSIRLYHSLTPNQPVFLRTK